ALASAAGHRRRGGHYRDAVEPVQCAQGVAPGTRGRFSGGIMNTAFLPSEAVKGRAAMVADGPLEKAVVCRQVTKEFGDGDSRVLALRGVDLDVYAGQMTLLVGPSGCGKTTLISIIAGLLDPTAGDVHVLGEDLRRLGKRRLVQFRGSHIGF